MRRTQHTVHVEAPPERVWDLLVRLEAYPTWTLWTTLSGGLRPGGFVRQQVRSPTLGTFAFSARVTDAEPARRLAWRTGHTALMGLDIFFEIVPEATGTRLSHGAVARGLLWWLAGLFVRTADPAISGVLADAKRRLEGGLRPRPASAPKTRTPRHIRPPMRKPRR